MLNTHSFDTHEFETKLPRTARYPELSVQNQMSCGRNMSNYPASSNIHVPHNHLEFFGPCKKRRSDRDQEIPVISIPW